MPNRKPSKDFLPLTWVEPNTRCEMDVRFDLCSGRGDLWGGVGLAAAMNALQELVEDMPIVFASAQFLANKPNAETLSLSCEIAKQGRTVARGFVVGKLDEVDFIHVSATLGKRSSPGAVDWATPAQIPHYADCMAVDLGDPRTAMHTHTELRLAHGMFGVTGQGTPSEKGLLSMWVRMPNVENDAGTVTILADYMLSGIGNSLGKVAYGVSLDNVIRIARIVPTDWVQCDIIMDHISDGFGYGTAHLFSEDGVLMATANQSVVVSVPDASGA